MTDLITEARELCEKATPGPWRFSINMLIVDGNGKGLFFEPGGKPNAAFIARSRTLVPELCDALEKANEQNKQLVHEVCKLACESVEREKTLARLEAEVKAKMEDKQ